MKILMGRISPTFYPTLWNFSPTSVSVANKYHSSHSLNFWYPNWMRLLISSLRVKGKLSNVIYHINLDTYFNDSTWPTCSFLCELVTNGIECSLNPQPRITFHPFRPFHIHFLTVYWDLCDDCWRLPFFLWKVTLLKLRMGEAVWFLFGSYWLALGIITHIWFTYIFYRMFLSFAKNVAGPPTTYFYEGKSLPRFWALFSMVWIKRLEIC